MALRQNSAEGQTSGTGLTAANSGGGSGDAFNTVSLSTGTIAFDNAQKMHATQSYHLQCAAAANTALMIYSGASAANVAIRAYLRFNALGSATAELIHLRNTAPLACKFIITAANNFQLQNSAGGTLTTWSGALSTGVWYRLEMQCIPATSTTGTINGAYYLGDSLTAVESFASGATTNAGTGNVDNGRVGKLTGIGTADVWWDDIAFDDTTSTPIGPVATARPTPPQVLNRVALIRAANW